MSDQQVRNKDCRIIRSLPPKSDSCPERPSDVAPSSPARFRKGVFDKNYKATIGVDFEMERFEVLGVPFSLQL